MILHLLISIILSESTQLTAANFEEFINANDRVLVEFYAPWCGHCKRLQPEYDAAAKELDADETSISKLAKVDAVASADIATKYNVRGYPTLKYFIGGDLENPIDYTGGRTKDKILSWVKTQELPAVSMLESQEDVDALLEKGQIVLVAHLSPEDDTGLAEVEKAADKLRSDLVVGVSTGNLLEDDMTAPVLAFYPPDLETPLYFFGEVTSASIMKIFKRERFPALGEIGPDNYQDYMDRGLPLVWIAVEPQAKATEAALDILEPFAVDRKGALSFVWVDAEKFAGHIENLGIDNVPGFLIINEQTNDKFKFVGDMTSESDLTDFFTRYDEGKLDIFRKTQSEPEETGDEAVKTLVGSNFVREALVQDKAVFVEFYAPWCGHCKKLAPEWEKLGKAFKHRDDVVIAKIDATENDTPESVDGFPTLVIYPVGCAEIGCGETYTGSRNSQELITYVNERVPESELETSSEGVDKDEL